MYRVLPTTTCHVIRFFHTGTTPCTIHFYLHFTLPEPKPPTPGHACRPPTPCRRSDPVAMLVAIASLAAALMHRPFGYVERERTRSFPITMLRNIDSCEAIIFTRDAAIDVTTGEPRCGVARLFAEADDQECLCAVVEPADRPIEAPVRALLGSHPVWTLRDSQPQITELNSLRQALCVDSPDGFGGSDGFNEAPGMAYGREPIAARCVVLVTTLQETIAAMGAGMRSIAIPIIEGDWVDEALEGIADMCLDELGDDGSPLALRVADVSTPGAYWLNPAMPRDVEGLAVDPETGTTLLSQKQVADASSEAAEAAALLENLSPPRPSSPPPPALGPPPPRLVQRCPPPRLALEIEPADAAALLLTQGAALLDVRPPT